MREEGQLHAAVFLSFGLNTKLIFFFFLEYLSQNSETEEQAAGGEWHLMSFVDTFFFLDLPGGPLSTIVRIPISPSIVPR